MGNVHVTRCFETSLPKLPILLAGNSHMARPGSIKARLWKQSVCIVFSELLCRHSTVYSLSLRIHPNPVCLRKPQAAAGEDAILDDDDVLSLTSSDPGASVLLAASPQEQVMAVEEEASEAASFYKPPCSVYAELLEVMERAPKAAAACRQRAP
ncbi:hypothetical protein DPX16_0110 [Anabarilius grahami]|uniref:Uncharacterized protein n=1 Tax=Anabarilius grahami TaxID=495550 RepID=A0A3N0YVS5_ANAGA|nr:hypothetical protein DPX16_0110 [Anabarilius grahami]